MLYQIEIHLHHDPDDEKPQIFSLDEEDDEKGIAYLPDVGDFVVSTRAKSPAGHSVTSWQGGGGLLHHDKCRPLTIPQRVQAQAH